MFPLRSDHLPFPIPPELIGVDSEEYTVLWYPVLTKKSDFDVNKCVQAKEKDQVTAMYRPEVNNRPNVSSGRPDLSARRPTEVPRPTAVLDRPMTSRHRSRMSRYRCAPYQEKEEHRVCDSWPAANANLEKSVTFSSNTTDSYRPNTSGNRPNTARNRPITARNRPITARTRPNMEPVTEMRPIGPISNRTIAGSGGEAVNYAKLPKYGVKKVPKLDDTRLDTKYLANNELHRASLGKPRGQWNQLGENVHTNIHLCCQCMM